MDQQTASLTPLAAEWEKVRAELRHPELHAMLRLMFFLGAHRTAAYLIRSQSPAMALVRLRQELREFEREIAEPKDEAA